MRQNMCIADPGVEEYKGQNTARKESSVKKERLDVLLVNRGLAESREKAKRTIMAGIVYVDGQKEDKAGSTFDPESEIEVRGNVLPYVSRGGLQLEKAIREFGVSWRSGSSRSMSATASSTGNSETIRVWSAWRRQTSAM